jgi:hypothetical protein
VAESGTDVCRFAERVNSVDVILTMHGTRMKNQIFPADEGHAGGS